MVKNNIELSVKAQNRRQRRISKQHAQIRKYGIIKLGYKLPGGYVSRNGG